MVGNWMEGGNWQGGGESAQGSIVRGGNWHRGQLSWGIVWGIIVLGVIGTGGNCPRGSCLGAIGLEGNCPGGNCLRVIAGGNWHEENCPEAIFLGVISRVIVRGAIVQEAIVLFPFKTYGRESWELCKKVKMESISFL